MQVHTAPAPTDALAALAFADFQRDLRRERRLAAGMERKRRREIIRFLGDAADVMRLMEAY